MAFNLLWYPLDFEGEGEELSLLDAFARLELDAVLTAIRSQLTSSQVVRDLIKLQNRTTISSQQPLPFNKIGLVALPIFTPPPPPPPQPTIKVDPMDFRSVDIAEGTGSVGQALRIIITALNDDLTIYGVLLTEQYHWNLLPADGVYTNVHDPLLPNGAPNPDYDPLKETLDLDSFPIVIPQNTWKAFFIELAPREGTISQTEPFETVTVAFIFSNATNLFTGDSEGDEMHQLITAIPGYESTDRRYFDNFVAVRGSGIVIPKENPGSPEPDYRVFPPAIPFPDLPPVTLPPLEETLGTIGFVVGGINGLAAQLFNRTVYSFNFSSETLLLEPLLTNRREWCATVGNSSQFYIAGGSRANRSIPFSSIDRYNYISDVMYRIGQTLDVPCDMMSGAPIKSLGYLFGGDAISWQDGAVERYGTLRRIRQINFGNENITTLGSQLSQSKALCNCTTGNKKNIWIFGGGIRETPGLDFNFFAHNPITSIEKFAVESETSTLLGSSLSVANSWRNATAGNRYRIYIAGGVQIATSKRIPNQTGLSTQTISRFDNTHETLISLGTQLTTPKDSISPMGGSKKIYWAGGFTNDGELLGSTAIEKLSNLDGLNNETLSTISKSLLANCSNGSGISDYNPGWS